MRFYFFILFFSVSVCVFGQETVDLETLKNKTFGHINRNKIYDGILINASVLPIDLEVYSWGAQTEVNYDTWIKIYNKIYSAHLDKPRIPLAREIFDKAEEYNKKGVVPLGICHFNYSAIRADAIENGLLRIVDDVLYEVSPLSKDNPYVVKECIVFAPFSRSNHDSGNVTFLLSNEFIFDNTGSKISTISVDFADGAGFREIRINEPVNIIYGSSGTKIIRMNLSMGEKKYSLKSTIQIEGGEQRSVKSGGDDYGDMRNTDHKETIQLNYNGTVYGGKWGVYYGCDNILNKPVIIIEGFDPLNSKRLDGDKSKNDLYAINDTKQHILNTLRSIGYDIIILDFNNNPNDLRINGMLAARLIEIINERKVGNNELIVMGRSGGGVLARYALAYLENNGINHQTRLLLTIDAPHQGANIPLGLQHFLDFISKEPTIGSMLGLAGLIMSADLLGSTINSVYAKQLLYYHHTATSNNAYPSTYKNDFFSNLNSLNGGYPKKLMKVAIACGSKYGGNQGFAFNENLLSWSKTDLPGKCALQNISIYTKALPDINTSGTIMRAHIQTRIPIIPCVLNSPWVTLASKTVNVNNALPYDNAPGGNAGWHNFNLDPFIVDLGFDLISAFTSDVSVEGDNSCFVPIVSAIDLNGSILPSAHGGLLYNAYSNLANNPHIVKVNNLFYNLSPPNVSPFDIIYVAPSNQEHGESNNEWNGLFDNAVTPANLYLQNQDIVNNRTYHARDQIVAGKNVTTSVPQGDFTIKAGTNVKMTSGNTIRLLPGFKTEQGAVFTASTHTETNCIIVNSSTKMTRLNNSDDDNNEAPDFSDNTYGSIFDIITSTEKSVMIYPNPANCCLVVSINNYSETGMIIEIYDAVGNVKHIEKNVNRISEINVSNYPAGMYVVKVTSNGQIFTEKFIKQ